MNTLPSAASSAADAIGGVADRKSRRSLVRKRSNVSKVTGFVLLSMMTTLSSAQNSRCIALKGSKACPAFQSASISNTDRELLQRYPFLGFVSDPKSFDEQMSAYVNTALVQKQYEGRFGCRGVDLRNSSKMYARWTTTVLCNTLVQMSRQPCSMTEDDARPVCAGTCAEFAQSEAFITADRSLCATPNSNLNDLIRADFTTCGLPDRSLSGRCVAGADNEPNNCGFGDNTIGLCSYCGAGGINSTDTCCYSSKAESRCEGVRLPSIMPTVTFITATASSTTIPTSTSSANPGEHGNKPSNDNKLSGGAIAGIVIGAIAGVALLAFLLFFCIRTMRKRKGSSHRGSVFNQPSPARNATPAAMYQKAQAAPQGYEVLPGGRIARMSALEGHSGNSPSRRGGSVANSGYTGGSQKKGSDAQSSSDEYGESPAFEQRGTLRPPPLAARRLGSLSSAGSDGGQMSPITSGGFSSPQQVASQQSEQLPFFKDYYSQDDIHPNNSVAVLWAYQPRAGDEFALERGDMLKVVGIWDDGWATGVMLNERAEEWHARRQSQRDSGVSNASQERPQRAESSATAAATGEMKAFPLVCVCVPQHWKKIIEGDGSTEAGSVMINPHRVE